MPAIWNASACHRPQKHLRLDFDYLVIQVFRDKVVDCGDIASDGLIKALTCLLSR